MEDVTSQLKTGISRQFSTGSLRRADRFSFRRQSSLDPQRQKSMRFSFGRQSSFDPIRRSTTDDYLTVPENLDATMQLLFMASRGDEHGLEELLDEGIDVNSIDLDGRTALHVAACEGHVDVVKVLLSRKANINARDRWGSTAAADAKYYGNMDVYTILKARGAKVPKTRRTAMVVENPKEVPEYELNPQEIQVRRGDGIAKGMYQLAKWNGTKVAVKILEKERHSDPGCISAFKYELTLLQKVRHPNVVRFVGAVTQNIPMMIVVEFHPRVRHPNVVRFVGAVTQNIPMMIVVEFHPRGDLGCYLQRKKRVSPSKALRFSLDIARGMNYLHECKPDPVVHCNLMPRNILLDCGGQLKIAGFGLRELSTLSSEKFKLPKEGLNFDLAGLYMPPEVHNEEIFDKSIDVYSFGVILYEMIEGVHPFHPKPPKEAAKLMIEGKRPPIKKLKHYPPELKELLDSCWSRDPAKRPNFAAIILQLDKVVASCAKQGWWKDTFKLPWV